MPTKISYSISIKWITSSLNTNLNNNACSLSPLIKKTARMLVNFYFTIDEMQWLVKKLHPAL